jgi:hypothetical protein
MPRREGEVFRFGTAISVSKKLIGAQNRRAPAFGRGL